jgi:hypothetical protein
MPPRSAPPRRGDSFAAGRPGSCPPARRAAQVDMAAFRLDDVVAPVAAQELGDARPVPGADDADDATVRQRTIGAAEVAEMFVAELSDGVRHRAEVVHQGVSLHLELLRDQSGSDDPRIVVASAPHPGSDRQRRWRRRSAAGNDASGEFLPGGLQAGMLGSLEGAGLAERGNRPFSIRASAKRAWVPPMSTATISLKAKPPSRPAWRTRRAQRRRLRRA